MDTKNGVKLPNKLLLGLIILGVTAMILGIISPFKGGMDYFWLSLFIISSLIMIIQARKSIGKIIIFVLYLVLGLYLLLN